MQYEKNNYELAKQDRNVEDQNLIVGQSDLSLYIKGRGSQARIGEGDSQGADGEGKYLSLLCCRDQ